MRRQMLRVAMIGGGLSILWVALFVWSGSSAMSRPVADVMFTLLEPWKQLCKAVTPDSWWTRGNILLGVMCAISGIVVYSILIRCILVGFIAAVDKISHRIRRRF